MKPTRRAASTASRLASAPLLASLALAACVPPPRETPPPSPPPPALIPVPTPAPPPPPPPPFAGNWMDAPLTPGDWSYSVGIARFGQPGLQPHLTMHCDRQAGVVEIARTGSVAGPLIVRAESAERSLNTIAAATGAAVARLPARDALLDAMAFSKGRFAVEAGGLPTLYVPSYPEVTRVIEDCR